jgi:hypothetical protein
VAFENPRAVAAAKTLAAIERVRRLKAQKKLDKLHVHGLDPDGATPRWLGQEQQVEEAHARDATYDVPDRLTGREAVAELRRLHPDRDWRFLEVDVTYEVRSLPARLM